MVTNFCSWAGALLARLTATARADSAPAAYLNFLILHSPRVWDAALLRCRRQRRNDIELSDPEGLTPLLQQLRRDQLRQEEGDAGPDAERHQYDDHRHQHDQRV